MKDLIAYYLRGLVYGITFIVFAAIIFGLMAFAVTHPYVGVPIVVLVVLPFIFGSLGEDK